MTYINDLLERKGISRTALAKRIGIDEGAIRHAAKSHFKTMGAGNVYKLAKELGVSMESLLNESGLEGGTASATLPIRFVTGGGAWVETERYAVSEPRQHPAILDPRFSAADQWYEQLRGDSINKLIPEGALMHVINGFRASYNHGDVVIIERTREGGHLLERSAKQVVLTSAGPEFWPRSTNPDWDGPIRMSDHNPDDETVGVQLVGVVKRAILDL